MSNAKQKVVPVVTKRKGSKPVRSSASYDRSGKTWWSQGYMGSLGGTF